jgi:hypothetical protein
MKCNETEKLILLQDSKEMDQKLAGGLAAHLHDCDPCQRFQHALIESQDLFQVLQEPPVAIVNEIKREARRRAPESKRRKVFYLKPALAMAATVLIALGFFLSSFRPDTVGLELMMTQTELLEPADQVVSVMYAGLSEDDLAFNFLMTYEEES